MALENAKAPEVGSESLKVTEEEDDELNELLKDALKDFGNVKLAAGNSNTNSFELSSNPSAKDEVKTTSDNSAWEAEFCKFQDQFLKIAQDGDQQFKEYPCMIDNGDLASSLQETMKNLAENCEFLKNPPSEDDMSRMFGNMTTDDNAMPANFPDLVPMMENVMQSLLSKDLLYPSLKEVVEQFPSWMSENKKHLEQKDYDRFDKQYNLMKDVCSEFESETSADSQQVKNDRFMRVLSLMQEMQAYGQPPKDLVNNLDLPLDQNGIPKLDAFAAEKCSIM